MEALSAYHPSWQRSVRNRIHLGIDGSCDVWHSQQRVDVLSTYVCIAGRIGSSVATNDGDPSTSRAGDRVITESGQPTVKEHQEHMTTQKPCRSWCKFCWMGRGVNSPHGCSRRFGRSGPRVSGSWVPCKSWVRGMAIAG